MVFPEVLNQHFIADEEFNLVNYFIYVAVLKYDSGLRLFCIV